MKNLKRVLALALVVAMVFSFAISASAATFSDGDDIKNTDAVNTLVELGVIKGYPEGDFRPEDPVTRAEMAKIITVILNRGVDDPTLFSDGVTDLTDIDWSWAKSYITYCYLLDIIAGYGNGEFRPEGNVTVQEAGKMLLAALGYDVEQEGLVGLNWAVNTNALATQAGLYEDVEQSVAAAATRDTIAAMVYNMLSAQTVSYDINYYTGISKLIKGERAISKYFGVIVYEGVIVANEFADTECDWYWDIDDEYVLDATENTPLSKNKTKMVFFDDDGDYNGYQTFNVASGENVLLKNCTIFYRESDKKVIGNVIVNGDNVVAAASKANLSDAAKAAGLSYKAANAEIYVNYEFIGKYMDDSGDFTHPLAPSAISSQIFDEHFNVKGPLAGLKAELIDFDNDGVVDYVNYVIPAISKVTVVDGDDITLGSFGEVKGDDIVTEDKLARNDIVQFTYVQGTYTITVLDTVEGKIASKVATGASQSITLDDGTKYTKSGVPVDSAIGDTIAISAADYKNYKLTLDAAGNLAYIKGVSASNDFALLLDLYTERNSETMRRDSKAVLFTADNKNIAVTVKNDGGFNFDDPFDDDDVIMVRYEADGSKYILDDATALAAAKDANGDFKFDVISYKDIASFSKGASRLTVDGSTVYVDASTVYFYAVKDGDDYDFYTYTGRANAPAISGTAKATVVAKAGEDVALAVFIEVAESKFDAVDAKTYAYIYKVGAQSAKQTTYSALLFNDKGELVSNTSDFVVGAKHSDANLGTLRQYTLNSDDVAKLGSAYSKDVLTSVTGGFVAEFGGDTALYADATIYKHITGDPKVMNRSDVKANQEVLMILDKGRVLVMIVTDEVEGALTETRDVFVAKDDDGDLEYYELDANGVPTGSAKTGLTDPDEEFNGADYYSATFSDYYDDVIVEAVAGPALTIVTYVEDDGNFAGAGGPYDVPAATTPVITIAGDAVSFGTLGSTLDEGDQFGAVIVDGDIVALFIVTP